MKFPTMDEFAKNVAKKALDEYEYKGKTLRQWIEIISASELSTNLASLGTDVPDINVGDMISRQAAIDAIRDMQAFEDDNGQPYLYLCDVMAVFTDEEELPPIQPVNCSEFPNNSDVVDRQKAKNAICNACGKIDCDEMDTCEKLDIPSEGSKLLQPWEVLVAQAVLPQPEIVRCEECKYHYQRNCPIEKYFSLNGFCSRGKRKEVTE